MTPEELAQRIAGCPCGGEFHADAADAVRRLAAIEKDVLPAIKDSTMEAAILRIGALEEREVKFALMTQQQRDVIAALEAENEALVDALNNDVPYLKHDVQRLERENTRLRAALRVIESADGCWCGPIASEALEPPVEGVPGLEGA